MEAKMKKNLMYGAGAVLVAGLLFLAFKPKAKTPAPPPVPSKPPVDSKSASAPTQDDFFEQEFGQTMTIPDTTTPEMSLRQATPTQTTPSATMPNVATGLMTAQSRK
jgi:hypothetical protein